MNTRELNVIIPVYNEQDSIENVLIKWQTELEKLEIAFQIHVYNDGSKDNTEEVLNDFAANNEKIIAHHKPNSGHGPTILLGYNQNTDSEWIFQIDSDDEMQPDCFKTLWDNRNQYDFLIGSRTNRQSPLARKIVSLISRLTVHIFYSSGVYDVNSPYRLMRTDHFKEYFKQIRDNTFAPNIVISGIAGLTKARIFETPVEYKFRTTGEVSIKKWKLFKAALKSFLQTIITRFILKV